LKSWQKLVERIKKSEKEIKIAMVGKYVDIGDYSLADSYISINHALIHAGAQLNTKVNIHWLDSKAFEKDEKAVKKLKEFDGIIIPGGFGSSGVEGKIKAIKFARENNIPFLGLCYGLQLAVVEFARNVCNLKNANTTEVNPKTPYPVIDILPTQKQLLKESKYGGTMRLGAYAAILKENSKVLGLYKERIKQDKQRLGKIKESFRLGIIQKNKPIILERHRHRYEVNPKYLSLLEKKGLIFSGYHIRKDKIPLAEFIELKKHKFFIATQAHPEFKSRLEDPAPLFLGFVKACKK
ncbi:MAG: hypothetical protein IIB81_03220, partial [Nanoarchaeota archaeon]|nr:hypothetical protein [Nanoarchaeota archaeon]